MSNGDNLAYIANVPKLSFMTHVGSGGHLSCDTINAYPAPMGDQALNWLHSETFAVLLTMGGSGGFIPLNKIYFTKTTGANAVFPDIAWHDPINVGPLFVTPVDQVTAIKFYLGLKISDIASILHVQRPTIYEWLSGTSPHQSNYRRLHQLYEIASEWRSLSYKQIGNYARTPRLGEKSLLNLLSQDTLDRDAITTALKIISEQLAAETEQREMRSITSKLKNRGFKELPQAEQITSLRRVSSRITDNKDE
jgi:hypothetical protein